MARRDNPGGGNRPTGVPITSTNPDPLATTNLNTGTFSGPGVVGTSPSFETQGYGGTQGGVGQQAKEQVRHLADDAKRQASQAAGQAGDFVSGMVNRQKDQAADRLGGVANTLRDVGNRLQDEADAGPIGEYASKAAEQIDRLSHYLRDRDVNTFFRDSETFARRHPDVFLGGTFLAGLLLARFLKSSSDRSNFDGYEGGAYASLGEDYRYADRSYGRSGFDGDDRNAYASYPGERYGRGNDYQGPQEPFRTREKEGPYGKAEGFKVPDTPGGA